VRPYTMELLNYLKDDFDLMVFTASHHKYANTMIDLIDPRNEIFIKRVFRDNCIKTKEGVMIKDLRIFKGRNLKDMVLVDNSSISFMWHYENGVPCLNYTDDFEDDQFIGLGRFLMTLKDVSDVRPLVFSHFCWKAFLDFPGRERDTIFEIFRMAGV
jgi:CTD small phosphatase-like protein 2